MNAKHFSYKSTDRQIQTQTIYVDICIFLTLPVEPHSPLLTKYKQASFVGHLITFKKYVTHCSASADQIRTE